MSHGPAKSRGMDTSHRTGNTYNTANAALHSTGDKRRYRILHAVCEYKGDAPTSPRLAPSDSIAQEGCGAAPIPRLRCYDRPPASPPSPCPYSQRRGSAGRLSLGSQIFWMRLCVSSMGMVKTKVFLRCSAATLGRLHGVGREKKK